MTAPSLGSQGEWIFLLPFVLTVSWLEGLGPGLATVAGCALIALVQVIPPLGSAAVDRAGVLRLTVFSAIATLVVGMTEHVRRQKRAAELSEMRLRVVQELSIDAFALLTAVRDDSGKVVDFEVAYLNPRAATILGFGGGRGEHSPARLRVVMSSWATGEMVVARLGQAPAGFQAHLAKPVDPVLLEAVVMRVAHGSHPDSYPPRS